MSGAARSFPRPDIRASCSISACRMAPTRTLLPFAKPKPTAAPSPKRTVISGAACAGPSTGGADSGFSLQARAAQTEMSKADIDIRLKPRCSLKLRMSALSLTSTWIFVSQAYAAQIFLRFLNLRCCIAGGNQSFDQICYLFIPPIRDLPSKRLWAVTPN